VLERLAHLASLCLGGESPLEDLFETSHERASEMLSLAHTSRSLMVWAIDAAIGTSTEAKLFLSFPRKVAEANFR